MAWYLPALCLLAYISCIESANILAVFPLAGKSHFTMFESVLRGLAARGHSLDVLSHFPQKPPIEGYNDLSLLGTTPIFTNNLTLDVLQNGPLGEMYLIMSSAGYENCEVTFNSDVAQKVRNSTKKYDVVLTELFTTDCMLGWGYHFKAPVVVLSSSAALSWTNDRFGNPDNPSYIPSFEVAYLPNMSLYERFINTYYLIRGKLIFNYYKSASERLAKKFFGEDMPSLRDLAYNTSLILVNSHFSIYQARPTVPNFIEVGGVHVRDPKPLNKHFEELLKTDSKGVIYFSMGSMMMTEHFAVEKLQGFADAFGELPYKVVWKANKDLFPKEVKFPNNIHFEKWMPQMDILCHPNVKLFVSHGGLMGSLEAVYCGVPRLGIPLFGEQQMNVKLAENMGLAIKVAYEDITKESILNAASKLLNDPRYRETAKLASDRFKDRPMSPLDTATYWIEYVIRHKGAPHLRSAGAGLAWYQYHLLDVAAIFVSIPIILSYLLYTVVKLLFGVKVQKSKRD